MEILKSFKSEIDQRIIMKKWAMIVGVTFMCLFFVVLVYAIYSVNCMPSEFMMKNGAVAIALIVAPIVSITAIAITFFIGNCSGRLRTLFQASWNGTRSHIGAIAVHMIGNEKTVELLAVSENSDHELT